MCGRIDVNLPFDDIFPPPDADLIVKAVMRFISRVKTPADALDDVLACFYEALRLFRMYLRLELRLTIY